MNRTKAAIIEAFWQLLEEKPFSKITVKDIVDRCQINRNTFYYHFHDIPDLLETTIKADADEVIQNYSQFDSPIECLSALIRHSLQRRKAMLHIYRSLQREVFLKQLERSTLYVVTQYIDTVTVELHVSPQDKALLIRFYKGMLIGVNLDWLDSGMDYDLQKNAGRINDLFLDAGKNAFLKAEQSYQEKNSKEE